MSNATKTAKRSDFKKYFQFMWRSLNIQASWNYERQMNMGFLYGIAPTLDCISAGRAVPRRERPRAAGAQKGSLRA